MHLIKLYFFHLCSFSFPPFQTFTRITLKRSLFMKLVLLSLVVVSTTVNCQDSSTEASSTTPLDCGYLAVPYKKTNLLLRWAMLQSRYNAELRISAVYIEGLCVVSSTPSTTAMLSSTTELISSTTESPTTTTEGFDCYWLKDSIDFITISDYYGDCCNTASVDYLNATYNDKWTTNKVKIDRRDYIRALRNSGLCGRSTTSTVISTSSTTITTTSEFESTGLASTLEAETSSKSGECMFSVTNNKMEFFLFLSLTIFPIPITSIDCFWLSESWSLAPEFPLTYNGKCCNKEAVDYCIMYYKDWMNNGRNYELLNVLNSLGYCYEQTSTEVSFRRVIKARRMTICFQRLSIYILLIYLYSANCQTPKDCGFLASSFQYRSNGTTKNYKGECCTISAVNYMDENRSNWRNEQLAENYVELLYSSGFCVSSTTTRITTTTIATTTSKLNCESVDPDCCSSESLAYLNNNKLLWKELWGLLGGLFLQDLENNGFCGLTVQSLIHLYEFINEPCDCCHATPNIGLMIILDLLILSQNKT
ncbi:Protein CBG25449 [Caenorhabditis briggsae]|uniref:Protein CBG25449 n=1 Tax=Caenorhabditis briggsae TaxID=6238 RepID=B6IES0_CAEBR|nr:Protein CBG25449 [Caenorhabditis briggsae]CAR98400.1 Protein CBG25449 [Caenorhabditis briggsae]